jgi:hypothetical protein
MIYYLKRLRTIDYSCLLLVGDGVKHWLRYDDNMEESNEH